MAFTMPSATGAYRIVTGTVQTSGLLVVGRMHRGSALVATVLLPEGRLITVRVDSGITPARGTPVAVRLYNSGAVQLVHAFLTADDSAANN